MCAKRFCNKIIFCLVFTLALGFALVLLLYKVIEKFKFSKKSTYKLRYGKYSMYRSTGFLSSILFGFPIITQRVRNVLHRRREFCSKNRCSLHAFQAPIPRMYNLNGQLTSGVV